MSEMLCKHAESRKLTILTIIIATENQYTQCVIAIPADIITHAGQQQKKETNKIGERGKFCVAFLQISEKKKRSEKKNRMSI